MSQSGILSVGGSPAVVLNLEGDTGGPVGPSGNIIFIEGGPGISVAGNPATSTLTINSLGTEATVQTTDATPTLLYSLTLSASQAALVTVTVVAPQDDYSSSIGGTALANVRRAAAGGAVVAGGPHSNLINDTGGTPEVTFSASGNDIEIYVTGVGATTYNWRGFIKVVYDT